VDIENYISSGILEGSAFDALSTQEKREVECMTHIYPEIKQELFRLHENVETMSKNLSLDVPDNVKKKIFARIENEPQAVNDSSHLKNEPGSISSSPKIIPINYWKWLAAASVILLIGISALFFNSQQSITQIQNELAIANKNSEAIKKESLEIKDQLAQITKKNEINSLLADDATQKIKMQGTENSPNSLVNIYWNTETKSVLLKVEKLPAPPSNKQYQLWAIVDGKPMDMGVLVINPLLKNILPISVKVENAKAFAISLERKGGSTVPDMTAIIVLGKV